jgi:hypothetical protein
LKRVDLAVNLTVDLAVDPVVKANNLAAAYYFYFLKYLNCYSIRLFLHHPFKYSQPSIISSPK